MPRILFIAPHRPDRSPGQRYRFEQFVPYWQRNGYEVDYAWFIDESDDAVFYSPGNLVSKARIFAKSWVRRMRHVRVSRDYDLLFLQREAFMTGSLRFERGFKRSGVPMVFDFDDAIWLSNVSPGNRRLNWLKDPAKTSAIIGMSDAVIAGNAYLADYARRFHKDVTIIPTVVDTDRYHPVERRPDGQVVIGWIGSHTSMTHLYEAMPLVQALHERFGERIRFRVISDRRFEAPGIPVEHVAWSSQGETSALSGIDIGIMPMPDDEWSRGKCGFKGIQYMGMGKPAVLSAVGVNTTIVQDGENGFTASTMEEWMHKVGMLVEDADLRARLGQAAFNTIRDRYSVAAWRDVYLALFDRMLGRTKRTDVRPETHRAHAHP